MENMNKKIEIEIESLHFNRSYIIVITKWRFSHALGHDINCIFIIEKKLFAFQYILAEFPNSRH